MNQPSSSSMTWTNRMRARRTETSSRKVDRAPGVLAVCCKATWRTVILTTNVPGPGRIRYLMSIQPLVQAAGPSKRLLTFGNKSGSFYHSPWRMRRHPCVALTRQSGENPRRCDFRNTPSNEDPDLLNASSGESDRGTLLWLPHRLCRLATYALSKNANRPYLVQDEKARA